MVNYMWQTRISSVIDLLSRLKSDKKPENQEWAIEYWSLVLERLKNQGKKING